MKKIVALITVAISYLKFATLALAIESINLGNVQSQGIKVDTTLNGLVRNVFTLVFSLSAIAVIVMLVWGGFSWITSGGAKEKIEGAQKRIMSALVGLAVLALAFVIARVVGSFLGFDLLQSFKLPNLGPSASPSPCANALSDGTCP